MSRTIFKYPLEVTDVQVLWLPPSAQVLSVQAQREVPTLWALVDPEAVANEPLAVYVIGTGNPADMPAGACYRGTVQQRGGDLVWHIFTAAGWPHSP